MLSFHSPFDPSGSICKTSDYGYSREWDSSDRGQGTVILGCLTSRAVFPSRLPAASHRSRCRRNSYPRVVETERCEVFHPAFPFSPVSIIPPLLHDHLSITEVT